METSLFGMCAGISDPAVGLMDHPMAASAESNLNGKIQTDDPTEICSSGAHNLHKQTMFRDANQSAFRMFLDTLDTSEPPVMSNVISMPGGMLNGASPHTSVKTEPVEQAACLKAEPVDETAWVKMELVDQTAMQSSQETENVVKEINTGRSVLDKWMDPSPRVSKTPNSEMLSSSQESLMAKFKLKNAIVYIEKLDPQILASLQQEKSVKVSYTLPQVNETMSSTSSTIYKVAATNQEASISGHQGFLESKKQVGVRNFCCSECHKWFTRKPDMIRHMKKYHKDANLLLYECSKCEASFSRMAQLKIHKKTSHNNLENLHNCPFCDKTFKNIPLLKSHVIKYHGGKGYEFECDTCGKCYKTMNVLDNHIFYMHSTHTDGKKFSCMFCKKKFNKRFSLQKHIKSHMKEFDSGSNLDGSLKCFPTSSTTSDLLNPVGIKPFVTKIHPCELCKQKFKTETELKKHLKNHKNRNLHFECFQCTHFFHSRSELAMHTKEKHFVKKYKGFSCFKCCRTFKPFNKAQNHILKYHFKYSQE